MASIDDQREHLLFILMNKTNDKIGKAIETFTYIRDNPELLSDEGFRSMTQHKIIELRSYIREEHKGLTNAVQEFYSEKTVLNQLKMEQESNKSRSFHPLQNVMDDVWEILQYGK
jgi:hypothetical protein